MEKTATKPDHEMPETMANVREQLERYLGRFRGMAVDIAPSRGTDLGY